MKIEIDPRSGFCFGVVNAIGKAQKELQTGEELYCLGDIVHNGEEVNRLESMGLKTIDYNGLSALSGKKVLLRAHGEPPSTYKTAFDRQNTIIDATCPVVLKLQKRIRESWEEMAKTNGQVVIFGKKGHAEVNGLVGQTNGGAIVLESMNQLGSIDLSRPVELFSQTTMDPDEYLELQKLLRSMMQPNFPGREVPLKVNNTICGQVANRKTEIARFAQKHQLILFVSGRKSSNGNVLFGVCRAANPNSLFVSSPDELKPEWFQGIDDVGICGATSTPVWLMEKVADRAKGMGSGNASH
jgi:4-hydroxy-3-methylbut-2-enyl diphosphate reductase